MIPYLTLIFVAYAAILNAVMDTIMFHYELSIFCSIGFDPFWWNPEVSWLNKYIDRNYSNPKKPRYKQWFSDAWHTAKAGMLLMIFMALAFTFGETIPDGWNLYAWFGWIITLCGAVWIGIFNLFYNHILVNKKP